MHHHHIHRMQQHHINTMNNIHRISQMNMANIQQVNRTIQNNMQRHNQFMQQQRQWQQQRERDFQMRQFQEQQRRLHDSMRRNNELQMEHLRHIRSVTENMPKPIHTQSNSSNVNNTQPIQPGEVVIDLRGFGQPAVYYGSANEGTPLIANTIQSDLAKQILIFVGVIMIITIPVIGWIIGGILILYACTM
jgi:hypothetical protein